MDVVRNGYEPLFRSSPFLEHLGQLFQRKTPSGGLVVAMAVDQVHCNRRGYAHGGVLCTLADVAMGYNAGFREREALPFVTVNLNLSFARSACLGEWVEAHTEIIKAGRRITIAATRLLVGESVIATATATFSAAVNPPG